MSQRRGLLTTKLNEQLWARRLLFEAIAYVCPRAIKAFKEDLWELYTAACSTLSGELTEWDDIKDSVDASDPQSALKNALIEWTKDLNLEQERFDHLEDDVIDPPTWLLSCLLYQLNIWFEEPEALDECIWGLWEYSPEAPDIDTHVTIANDYDPFQINSIYEPHEESRNTAKERIMHHLERQVDAELDRIEGQAREMGFQKHPTPYKPNIHLERLLKFQVCVMSEYEILGAERGSEPSSLDTTTINKSLHQTQKLLAFRRRKPTDKPRTKYRPSGLSAI